MKLRVLGLLVAAHAASPALATGAADTRSAVLADSQRAVAKVYGAGGVSGLEGYQTGVFVGEAGPVVTIDSLVLDGDTVTLVDAYGDRCEGTVLGRDPATGLALVACPESTVAPAVADFAAGATAESAQRVWVLCNAFGVATGDEPVGVQRAWVAAVAPMPLAGEVDQAKRPKPGVPPAGAEVLLLDAVTSNPGAGGGLVVDPSGAALGVLGAECRSPLTGAWVNYAVPAVEVAAAIERILAEDGASETAGPAALARWRPGLRRHGVALLPSLADRTPAYVEYVEPASAAEASGLRPDDLVVAVEGATVSDSEAAGAAAWRTLQSRGAVSITVLRGKGVETLTLRNDQPTKDAP